jgi:hypothetical protein
VSSLKQTTTTAIVILLPSSFSFHRLRRHHHHKFSATNTKSTGSDLKELGDMHLSESTHHPSRRRRNAVVLQDEDGDRDGGTEQVQPRRNAVAPFTLQADDEDVGDEIQVSHSRVDEPKNRASAEKVKVKVKVKEEDEQPEAKKDKKQAREIIKQPNEIHYIRAGRRTIEDEPGDIPTQFVVVAKIDKTKKTTAKSKFSWLSVATWQLNGLRIGTVASGDRIPERDDYLGYTTGLNPDPFFVARNAGSIQGIREVLLDRVERGEVGVQEETLDDEMAQDEREEAQESRMLEAYGPEVICGGDEAVRKIAARQDAELRFPHLWALPVAPTRSTSSFPDDLDGFRSVASDVAITSINVVATFANEIDGGRDLRLKHFMEVAFEPDETLESAKHYFLKGDEVAKFRGLEDNRFLSKKWWLLELWILPQFPGCSMLYKWDDTPELTAREFCDARAFEGGGDVEPELYVEVRIVQDPDHLGGESEEEVSSSGSEDEPC